ncbi:proton channel OtopLc isoform X2 [Diorhabda sublineata]|uniref:proton channel OtopLc isoform X2 n=1 Tax=Diorhabda sublineata TaxID=1163346 RepID=UPI0024E17726|nr:proton channel OtopLc isoform X2 [Diorhabda sublineata]
MQRCPYLYEMKERLLEDTIPMKIIMPKEVPPPCPPLPKDQQPLIVQHKPVATIVKIDNAGLTHTTPTHCTADQTPLVPEKPESKFFPICQKIFPKNAKTSLFIVTSFVYAKLLVVICIAYVISDIVTHNIPPYYYEGFFTYLYGFSILFLLYVFCFLLQESSCCSGNEKQPKPVPKKNVKDKEVKNKKEKDDKEKKKKEAEAQKKQKKEKKDKKDKKQEKSTYRRNSEGVVDAGLAAVPVPVEEITQSQAATVVSQEQPPVAPAAPAAPGATTAQQTTRQPTPPADSVAIESSSDSKIKCKRKTSQNDHSHGSFFLRIGAIAFGLGTMIYIGLEFGVFFEVPFNSPCYMILKGVNPTLQMIFTFMQMYFIFMNSRLNIHRFKVIARFGLMHIVATNICVWIRTFFIEYLKDITKYHLKFNNSTNLSSEEAFSGSHKAIPDKVLQTTTSFTTLPPVSTTVATFFNKIVTTLRPSPHNPNPWYFPITTTVKNSPGNLWKMVTTTTSTTSTTTTTTTPSPTTTRIIPKTTVARVWRAITTSLSSSATPSATTTTTSTTPPITSKATFTTPTTTALPTTISFHNLFDSSLVRSITADNINSASENNVADLFPEIGNTHTNNETEFLNDIIPQAFTFTSLYNRTSNNSDHCGRLNIMGTIVEDSGPYLYPFIIEFSLIGAAVIFVMWKHIGRNPKYVNQENLEHRLEIMLSRRAVALAQAQQHGRVDCVGASKGLFFGLLMLVGSLICLILFFVLVSNNTFRVLAVYLAEVSHCALLVLSIIAILIGFIRVKSLKFKKEEQSDLNDILLRISAFGLFLYAVFSVIAGHLHAFSQDANLLAMITGILVVIQVILQLLFIADVSRRRVHLPEHDRSKPGRQVVTFLLICNITIWIIYTFEMKKVEENPVQLKYYGYLTWAMVQRLTLPLCIFHRFHSAVALAEIWKTSYKPRLE